MAGGVGVGGVLLGPGNGLAVTTTVGSLLAAGEGLRTGVLVWIAVALGGAVGTGSCSSKAIADGPEPPPPSKPRTSSTMVSLSSWIRATIGSSA